MQYLAHYTVSGLQLNEPWQGLPEVDLQPFDVISKTQMTKALIYFNILTAIDRALENVDAQSRETWQNATEFHRDDAFLKQLAKKINISELQLDFIFEIGATM
jgi:hypothetical protein